MPNLPNLEAETNADYIGDGTEPAVRFRNTSTGPGLMAEGLAVSSTASIDILHAASRSATSPGVVASQAVVGNMSIGILRIVGNSVASGAAFEFSNKAFASITSVVLTSVANTDYAIRVQVGNETRWIPLFKDAALIGAAAF